MKVVVIDLNRPRRKLQQNHQVLYVIILGVLAAKGWWSLWP